MTSILSDTIPGIRVVKAFAQERREIERFRGQQRPHRGGQRPGECGLDLFLADGRVCSTRWACWSSGWSESGGPSTRGSPWGPRWHRTCVFVGRIYTRLESMSRMATNSQRAAASAQRIFEILDRVPSVPEPADPVVSRGPCRGPSKLKNISFRYGNRRVIDNVSLAIRPGEMIGLVGTTGAGKSTLVNLVCRFYDVSDGAILVDGVDVRAFRVAELSPAHRHRAAGPVLCFTARSPRTSPTANRRRHARRSLRPRGRPALTNSSCSFPTDTTRSSASAARRFREESGSGFRSPVRC